MRSNHSTLLCPSHAGAMYYRSNLADTEQSLAIHIWMINTLLKRSLLPFSYYVVAACYRRTLRRVKYRTSHSFLRALKRLQTVEFSEKFYHPSDSEKAIDVDFLSNLNQIKPLFNFNIPNLMMQAKQQGPDCNFYTKETCKEFHLLLCTLLERFCNSVMDLDEMQQQTSSRRSPGMVDRIVGQLQLVARFGNAIRLMVRGSAIKKHLKVIEDFLPGRVEFAKAKEEDNPDANEDLIDLQTDTGKTQGKWKTCWNWMVMLVTHFDAIQELAHFVKTQQQLPKFDIDMKIFFQSPPNLRMLTWKALLKNPKYFPDGLDPSTDEIIAFLNPSTPTPTPMPTGKRGRKGKKSGTSAEVAVESLYALCESDFHSKNARNDAIDKIISQLTTLNDCKSAVSETYTETIIEELQKTQKNWEDYDSDGRTDNITEIVGMIKTLRDNAKLSSDLKEGTPLSSGIGFKGDFHCEALLTTFCTGSTNVNGLKPFVSLPCRRPIKIFLMRVIII